VAVEADSHPEANAIELVDGELVWSGTITDPPVSQEGSDGEPLAYELRLGLHPMQPLPVPYIWEPADPDTLQRFMNAALHDDQDRQLAFARRYGVLGPPFAHVDTTSIELPHDAVPPGAWIVRYMEPLSAWRDLAMHAEALLTATLPSSLRDRLPAPADWAALVTAFNRANSRLVLDVHPLELMDRPESVSAARLLIADQLNRLWIEPAQLTARLSVRGEGMMYVYASAVGLRAVLAQQLVMAIASEDRLFTPICSACGVTYNTRRAPRQTGRHYCLDCRQSRVPQRDASRTYRRNKKEGADEA